MGLSWDILSMFLQAEQQGPAYLTTGQFAPHALGRRDRPEAVQNARHQACDMRMQSNMVKLGVSIRLVLFCVKSLSTDGQFGKTLTDSCVMLSWSVILRFFSEIWVTTELDQQSILGVVISSIVFFIEVRYTQYWFCWAQSDLRSVPFIPTLRARVLFALLWVMGVATQTKPPHVCSCSRRRSQDGSFFNPCKATTSERRAIGQNNTKNAASKYDVTPAVWHHLRGRELQE